MNVVDSSGWLEYFGDGPNAEFFEPAIEDVPSLVVPAISLFEVFKRACLQSGEGEALRVIAHMQQGLIVPLDAPLALEAAQVSLAYNLPMADSIILAVARGYGATLWTQDEDFKGLPDVQYIPYAKRPGA